MDGLKSQLNDTRHWLEARTKDYERVKAELECETAKFKVKANWKKEDEEERRR